MKILLLIALCCIPIRADAADDSEIPMIDLRARSIRMTRAAAASNSATTATQPQSLPAAAPVAQKSSQPQRPAITYTPPPSREKRQIAGQKTSQNLDSDEISNYVENNPQVKPDV